MATKISLADFYQYGRDNRKRIGDIYREIEEIQYQFNDLYKRQVEERDKLISAHVPLLLDATDLPPELRELLDKQEQAEREAIQTEMKKLEGEIAEKQQKADDLVREAQRQVTFLREQNPILDQQEEELKARRASMEGQIQDLDAEIDRAGLTGFLKRRRLRKEREHVVENLDEVEAGIRAVREKWQAEKQRLQASQTDLQGKWQALSVETAQLQARLDYLGANIDEQSKLRAAQNLLHNLKEVPAVEGPWKERLSPVVELGHNKTNYEQGLRSLAEILGLLQGLGDGMDRLLRSVATVYEEQRRYNLAPLTVAVSDVVTSFHATWPQFQSEVKDEKYLGTHPLEFNRRIQAVVQEHINEDDIQKMFDDMGDALAKATSAWR